MSQPHVTRRSAWLPFVVVGAAVVVIALVLSVLSSGNQPDDTARSTFTLTGTLSVPSRVTTFVPGDGCIAEVGYDDIQTGSRVTVYDQAGKALGVGQAGSGKKDGLRCTYSLTVPGVPSGVGVYQVEVGDRGKVAFTESVLTSIGASLTLG